MLYYLICVLLGSVLAFLCGVLSILYLQHSDVKSFLNGDGDSFPEELPLEVPAPAKDSPALVQATTEGPEPKTSVQSKTKKLFAQSGLESFFKKSSLKVAGLKDKDPPPPYDRIKVHGEPRGGSPARVGAHGDLECDGVRDKMEKKKFTGVRHLDFLLHTIIDYILRDFIDSWFSAVSDDKEFVDVRARQSIEESIANVCLRIKSTRWQPIITTNMVDHLSTHTRLYRLAQQAVQKPQPAAVPSHHRLSPFRKVPAGAGDGSRNHRRNKSDTDLNWHLGHVNRKHTKDINEECLFDPELKLLHAFFDHSGEFRAECLDERQLEQYLTNISETLLYFTLPDDDFACLPLRTFLSTLLANVVFKPVLDMLSDPDFVNLQVARLMGKETPPVEFFIKMVRQCSDLSELRACRQLVTKEMHSKFKDSASNPELGSLRYAQKLIDQRINQLQNLETDSGGKRERSVKKDVPILSLEEILTKQLALSYYLDYLSILNLQKYVLFYMSAQEWKQDLIQDCCDLTANKLRVSRDELLAEYRERALNLYKEYCTPGSNNFLTIDSGLVEVLNIKLRDHMLPPEGIWFDSICKFIYEKIKTEEVFLHNFYQSSAYKKLLLELDEEGQDLLGADSLLSTDGSGSDNNSGDIPYEVFESRPSAKRVANDKDLIRLGCDLTSTPFLSTPSSGGNGPGGGRHNRSHSDCSGIVTLGAFIEIDGPSAAGKEGDRKGTERFKRSQESLVENRPPQSGPVKKSVPEIALVQEPPQPIQFIPEELSARIINTAINTEGQFAVYAIEVVVSAQGKLLRQWHVYRRYSKFLELKKTLEKRYPKAPSLPFPPKKTFQNTQRAVLEHRMTILNEFLKEICRRMHINSDMTGYVKEFLEADPIDQRISGGTTGGGGNVTRTLEIIVNPFKSGMTKIKNMPESLVGGLSRLFLGGRGPLKQHHSSYLITNPSIQMDASEYPALRSMLNLMDEVFDLQTRSQWLRRGIVNRVLGAPWVSSAANKKIIQAAKGLIEEDKLEMLLTNIISAIWPDGQRSAGQPQREDNTKLRTRMAAKVSLFALLADDLGHIVGSETTRWGLLNMYSMWQNKTLNMRLCLVVLEDALKKIYNVDSLTKHTDRLRASN